MKEWIVVACRAEAKIFERDNKLQDLRWVETLTNKKGRHKERDFESDKPGRSYAKFSMVTSPH
ncbi:MAG: host attachment protein, partial [Patescibacteria group bacterium]